MFELAAYAPDEVVGFGRVGGWCVVEKPAGQRLKSVCLLHKF